MTAKRGKRKPAKSKPAPTKKRKTPSKISPKPKTKPKAKKAPPSKAALRARARREELRFIREAEAGRAAERAQRKTERQRERRVENDSTKWLKRIAKIVGARLELVDTQSTWANAGRLEFDEPVSQEEFASKMRDLETARALERSINPDRRSRIIVEHDGKGKSIPSSVGPWEAVVSEMGETFDPRGGRARYKLDSEAEITAFYVEFATRIV